jgi:glycosyltransferase involved in cell wall biosynthesis
MSVRFSILVPAYNRERYIAQAVESVLKQSFQSYELFVVDDGSTDKTVAIVQSYGLRVNVLRQANQGPEVARNRAAAAAQGEYLVFLDSDDLLLPNALATYDRIIREFDAPPVIVGAMADFKDGRPPTSVEEPAAAVKVIKFRDYLSKDVKLALSSSRIVLKRSVFEEVGGLRNTTAKTFHLDSLNLILKIGTYGPCMVVRAPHTVGYRHHANNTIRNIKPIIDGILTVAAAECRGDYRGDKNRQLDRRAAIGAVALSWAFSLAPRRGNFRQPIRLITGMAPMMTAALYRKATTYLKKRSEPITISAPFVESTPALENTRRPI